MGVEYRYIPLVRSDLISILRAYVINIYIYRTRSNLYTPDSVSLASLARQLPEANKYKNLTIIVY